jgi:hypothetical protein
MLSRDGVNPGTSCPNLYYSLSLYYRHPHPCASSATARMPFSVASPRNRASPTTRIPSMAHGSRIPSMVLDSRAPSAPFHPWQSLPLRPSIHGTTPKVCRRAGTMALAAQQQKKQEEEEERGRRRHGGGEAACHRDRGRPRCATARSRSGISPWR